jgi:hypothetical protein
MKSDFIAIVDRMINLLDCVVLSCSGNCPPKFFEAMEAEHCSREGFDFEFQKKGKISHPKKEWNIVMKQRPCPIGELTGRRRIPDIDTLQKLPQAEKANLQKSEVIAVVLYTGPMVSFLSYELVH